MNARTLKKLERRRRFWMSLGFLAFLALLCYDVVELKTVRRSDPYRSMAHAAVKASAVTATEAPDPAPSAKDSPAPYFVSSANPVPEPSTLLLFAPVLFLLTSRGKPSAKQNL